MIDTARPPITPSAWRAFAALVTLSVARQWRVRGMGLVAFALLALLATIVGLLTRSDAGWGLPGRYWFRYQTEVRHVPTLLDAVQMSPGTADDLGVRAALLAPLRVVLADPAFLNDWAFLNYARWTVFSMTLTFYLPLVTLAYASSALGGEREARTLIWLTTRPLPRFAIYLAKFLGALPWCLLAGVGGFAVLCLAGGELGRRAFVAYGATIAGVTVAFAALFHLLGALFKRPAVVGLVYIFFFETLVANLPGSLKQLSLNYYARSLLYHDSESALRVIGTAGLEVYAPAEPAAAWATLAAATVAFTLVGMAAFGRQEGGEAD